MKKFKIQLRQKVAYDSDKEYYLHADDMIKDGWGIALEERTYLDYPIVVTYFKDLNKDTPTEPLVLL